MPASIRSLRPLRQVAPTRVAPEMMNGQWVGNSGPLVIEADLKGLREDKEKVLYATAVQHSIRATQDKLSHSFVLKLDILQGEPKEIPLTLSGAGEIRQVTGAGLLDWSIRQETNGARFLVLRFPKTDKPFTQFVATVTAETELKELPATVTPLTLAPAQPALFHGYVKVEAVPELAVGDEVIVTGYDLGMNTAGGFAQYIRVPAAWVIRRPAGLSLREAMLLGTAGLTAGLCVDKLEQAGLTPAAGPVLVTGASGGVGSIAVALLASLGYDVAASTGKAEQGEFLRQLGARQIVPRSELQEGSEKALLKERWAGAVDTVGGDILFNVVKSLRYGGSAACCGLTAGMGFKGSVAPFILRGVNLLGVDSVELPLVVKASMWDKLSLQWKLGSLESLAEEVTLEQLPAAIEQILAGRMVGRVLVRLD